LQHSENIKVNKSRKINKYFT